MRRHTRTFFLAYLTVTVLFLSACTVSQRPHFSIPTHKGPDILASAQYQHALNSNKYMTCYSILSHYSEKDLRDELRQSNKLLVETNRDLYRLHLALIYLMPAKSFTNYSKSRQLFEKISTERFSNNDEILGLIAFLKDFIGENKSLTASNTLLYNKLNQARKRIDILEKNVQTLEQHSKTLTQQIQELKNVERIIQHRKKDITK